MYKDIFEFVVWDNCSNNCSFCWQKQHFKLSSFVQKTNALLNILNFVNSKTYTNGSHLLIVGGELFDDNNIEFNTHLINFFQSISKLQKDNNIDLLYLNTNLLYDIKTSLIPVLQIFEQNDLLSRIKFTTSWDLVGRFNNDEKIWYDNLLTLQKMFPTLNIVVNTIITKQLCSAILLENRKLISEKVNCYVNYIPYINVNDILTPSKNDVFKFLLHVNQIHKNYLKQYVENFDLHQNKFVYKWNNKTFENCTSEKNECGHSINFKKYSNDNTCFICDIKKLQDLVE